MARYINANEIRYHQKENIDGYVYSEYVSKDEIDAMPDADVKPIKHGHWICIGDIDEYIFECSECHEIYYLNDGTPKEHKYNYCPNCGAKLCKGEENNA